MSAMMRSLVICCCLLSIGLIGSAHIDETTEAARPGGEEPSVLVCLLVRNKAHVLPLFLSLFERLTYPKDRIDLWIRSDHNEDNSDEILTKWLNASRQAYHSVDVNIELSPQAFTNQTSPLEWTDERFQHLIQLKEQALQYGYQKQADFIFFLDVDVFLTNPDTLQYLVNLQLPIVAPMLLSEGLYSNFWCGMTPEYYYLRTEEYQEIYNAKKIGSFPVPMVHSAVLVNLKYVSTRQLTFDKEQLLRQQMEPEAKELARCPRYSGPLDDIIVFAIAANCSGIPLHVNNDLAYGYVMQPLDVGDSIEVDKQQLVNVKANIIHDLGEVPALNELFQEYQESVEKHKLSLNHIYMINLERRPERREKMEKLFAVLGLDVEYFAAIDGKKLDLNIVSEMGIKFLDGYEDPYHHRPMTMGEIGCFLSHYRIWEQIVERGQKEVLILEDDIRFEPYFRERAEGVLDQARKVVDYDLLYFGRKRLKEENEPAVLGAERLVHAGYSYWTLGYAISLEGARKLLAAKPLEKLLPVDEYLPIMFNRHPNKTWSSHFEPRNLIALSASPLLLYPTHYTGEEGYISDTEDSLVTSSALRQGNSAQMDVQLKSDREIYYPTRVTQPAVPVELSDAATTVGGKDEL